MIRTNSTVDRFEGKSLILNHSHDLAANIHRNFLQIVASSNSGMKVTATDEQELQFMTIGNKFEIIHSGEL